MKAIAAKTIFFIVIIFFFIVIIFFFNIIFFLFIAPETTPEPLSPGISAENLYGIVLQAEADEDEEDHQDEEDSDEEAE